MAQKIDINGLFIDPESISDLLLQKRISVFFPVFYEIPQPKRFFNRSTTTQHILQFDHQEPYGIILADIEQPDSSGYVVNYKEAIADKIFKAVGKAGKNVVGHAAEVLKIDVSGDRHYRILQSGRNVKNVSIREIPAKVHLLSGQWVDVFKGNRDYDFQGGNPYAITDVGANALTITIVEKKVERYYVLYGAGVDASNEEVLSAYKILTELFNEIQARREEVISEQVKTHKLRAELPKLSLPKIKFQSPFVIEKRQPNTTSETLPASSSDTSSSDESTSQS